MKASDYLVAAAAATLAYWLIRWSRTDPGALQGYMRYANSAPPGFVYDPVLDAFARTREDGVKEVYV